MPRKVILFMSRDRALCLRTSLEYYLKSLKDYICKSDYDTGYVECYEIVCSLLDDIDEQLIESEY